MKKRFSTVWNHLSRQWFYYFCAASIFAGFVISRSGLQTWDDGIQTVYSHWLLSKYGLAKSFSFADPEIWYGPLWDLFLGLSNFFLYPILRDIPLVRNSLTFALFPISLAGTYLLLRQSKLSRPHALLCVSLLYSTIRFGGHALVNSKDFPTAAGYLLATLGIWVLLTRRITYSTLVTLGVLSFIPYVLRPLLFIHVASLEIMLLLTGKTRKIPRWVCVTLPLVAGLVFLFSIYPASWNLSYDSWIHSVMWMTHKKTGLSRIFGVQFSLASTPRWYPFVWLPIMLHPIALCAATFSFFFLFHSKPNFETLLLNIRSYRFRISILHWVGMIVLTTWMAVLFARVPLYDDERHILFIYPVLILFCGLCLQKLSVKFQYCLSIILILASTNSYMSWGRYAYVYISPIIADTRPSQFMGDYWAACVAKLAIQLKSVESGSIIVARKGLKNLPDLKGPFSIIESQVRRYNNSKVVGEKDFPALKLRGTPPTSGPYYLVAGNRFAQGWERLFTLENVIADVQKGRAKIMYIEKMPPNSAACALVHYPKG